MYSPPLSATNEVVMQKTIVAKSCHQAPWTAKAVEELFDAYPVVLFSRGTREVPKCGFTARAFDILDRAGIDYYSLDVVADKSLIPALTTIFGRCNFPALVANKQIAFDFDQFQALVQSLGSTNDSMTANA